LPRSTNDKETIQVYNHKNQILFSGLMPDPIEDYVHISAIVHYKEKPKVFKDIDEFMTDLIDIKITPVSSDV